MKVLLLALLAFPLAALDVAVVAQSINPFGVPDVTEVVVDGGHYLIMTYHGNSFVVPKILPPPAVVTQPFIPPPLPTENDGIDHSQTYGAIPKGWELEGDERTEGGVLHHIKKDNRK